MKLNPLGGRGNEYLKTPVDSKIIWVDRFKKGFKRLQRSLRTSNPPEARSERDRLFVEHFGERPVISDTVRLLSKDLFPNWEKTKARKSEATKDSIKYSFKHINPFIDHFYPDQINEAWWENTYIPAKLAESPDRKFANEQKWLMTYLNYLHREGFLKRLPQLKNPDGPSEEGLNLDDTEMSALYAEANLDLQLQIDLGFKHFMRRSEVCLLPWCEIDFKEGVINLPAERTKIRKARTVPLSSETLSVLIARKSKSDSPYVFPSPGRPDRSIGRKGNDTAWKRAIDRANRKTPVIRPEATFHDLRHSGLTRAFVATNRYAEICVMAGLSLEEAQRTYLHLKPEHTRFVAELVQLKNVAVVENDVERQGLT